MSSFLLMGVLLSEGTDPLRTLILFKVHPFIEVF